MQFSPIFSTKVMVVSSTEEKEIIFNLHKPTDNFFLNVVSLLSFLLIPGPGNIYFSSQCIDSVTCD